MPHRAGLTASAVTAAAAAIADEHGLEGVTLARVARELGVEPPSLYEHVPGLRGVHLALRLRGFRSLIDLSRKVTVGRSRDQAVVALGNELRAFVTEHPGLYEATVRSAEGDTPEIERSARELLEVYLAVLQGYGLRGKEAIHALRYLRSTLHGFTSLESAGGFGMPEDINASYRRLLRAVTGNLKRWSQAAGGG